MLVQLELESELESEQMAEMSVDWNRMFQKGLCPKDIKGMEKLVPSKLSGEWFMQRSTEFLQQEMTPTCHHASMLIGEDGNFVANEEAKFMGKTWIAENITGLYTNSNVRADFFDKKLSLNVMIMDTDYDNYMIGYQCFDNMKFALEKEIEPVHITKFAILTRKSDEKADVISTFEDKAVALLPFMDKKRFSEIKHVDCNYQTFDLKKLGKSEKLESKVENVKKIATGVKKELKEKKIEE